MAHPPRIPVLLPAEKTVVYFLTLCVDGREHVLANAAAMSAFQKVVKRLEGRWIIPCATLMPDHLHFIAIPHEREASIGDLSAAIKRWMRQIIQAKWRWQPGCFDRLLRSGESADAKWHYIRENPVRAGLVKDWKEWPWHLGVDPEKPLDIPFPVEL